MAELKKIADLYPDLHPESKWVTFDAPGPFHAGWPECPVHFSRGDPRWIGDLACTPHCVQDSSNRVAHYVVSTGAAVAVSFLPLASAMGARTLYVESLTRTHAPSTTGRILSLVPAVETFTQYKRWANDRWKFAGSILDNWEVRPRDRRAPGRNVLVSLGTIHPYRFDRAVDAVKAMLPKECSVTWQLGATSRNDVPGVAHAELPWAEMGKLIREADAFVCHAGVGSVLQALDNGAVPLLAVRSAQRVSMWMTTEAAQEIVTRGLGQILELSGGGNSAFEEVARVEPQKPAEKRGQQRFHPCLCWFVWAS